MTLAMKRAFRNKQTIKKDTELNLQNSAPGNTEQVWCEKSQPERITFTQRLYIYCYPIHNRLSLPKAYTLFILHKCQHVSIVIKPTSPHLSYYFSKNSLLHFIYKNDPMLFSTLL